MNEKWREMLQSSIYHERLFAVVTDEAHVIPKWGFGNSKEKLIAFRECFGRLGELRSLIPDCTPILALTATAAQKTKEEIVTSLSFRTDHYEIIVSPDRPKIYLYRAKVQYVLHYGLPRNVEDFLQEIERGGRDGKSAMAILLFRGKHLRKCDTSIKNYSNGDNVECLRTHILSEFFQIKHDSVRHDCCLLCHEKCHCNGDNPCDKQIPINLHKNRPESNSKTLWKKRKVMADEIKLLEELLNDYQQKLITCNITYMCAEVFGDFDVHIDEKYTNMAKTSQAVSGDGFYDLDFGGIYAEYHEESESSESECEFP
ncbi:Werner syndrome ATP-dependent helicase-like [Paramuricea clavata]|uniref:DNA 3'-5' helicase n=1 Tax=Paramuricea clavata TaxID=317549 RepID=A0A7D9HAF1_PARCT|nr:Werner syndrome ATP-dependent helicase-like [Paramuricea clavata]